MTEEERAEKPEAVAGAPEAPAEVDMDALQKALAETKEKADANLAGWQRAQADFINYKRRCEQEKEDSRKSANAALLLKMLPIVDDLERAMGQIPEDADQKWAEGVRLIERKLKSCLELQGITPIKSVGEPFDPRFHEALKQDKGKEGTVVLEIERGYMLGDHVLRPAKVIVGNGEEETEQEGPVEA